MAPRTPTRPGPRRPRPRPRPLPRQRPSRRRRPAPPIALALAATLAAAPPLAAQDRTGPATPVDVAVDPRVELLSIVFRLAGANEYGQARVPAYAAAVDEWFAAARDHAVVQHARRVRAERGVGYDAVMSFALHLRAVDPVAAAMPFAPLPERLDRRWGTPDDAVAFLRDLAEFARATDAAGFFAAQRELHATAVARMRETLARHADLDWFGRFFGGRPTARFRLALGLLNGGANYGPSVLNPDGTEDLYCVLGCWTTDDDGLPLFPRTVTSTVAHEFCHSFCNPLIDAALAAPDSPLADLGRRLYDPVAGPMRDQAYGTARTLLCESLVRACVIRYVTATATAEAAEREAEEQQRRWFLWVPALADVLQEYERSRDEHPTLAAFMPRITAFLAEHVPQYEAAMARRPQVAAIAPADGAADVDPATAAIVITFDRPMQAGMWALTGGGSAFPKTRGQPSYDATRTVLTVPVELEPGRTYRFGLNGPNHRSFRSEAGEELVPVRVTFATRPD